MSEWTTTAFVFPGQGSQEVGMGADLAERFPAAKAVFEQADQILGVSLSDLCFNGPAEELNDTYNTQPALYVMGIAVLRVLEAALPTPPRPAFVAGHSLGEFTALTASGALSFEDGVRLVRERGRLMKKAGERTPGAMAALLGLSSDVVRELCTEASAKTGKPVVLANDNCDGQLVISGDKDAIEAAMPLAMERGAKKVVPLTVSVASHSPLMESISAEFRQHLDQTAFTAPTLPVIGNVSAAPLSTVDEIRFELGAQLTSTVRWTESVGYMLNQGVQRFVELGPKDVLSGLIKRIDRSAQRAALNNAAAVEAFLGDL
ncbi:MAG TPA: ACP S-malonyltransferase [Aggregatilinea sp.]|uniref:ACP S-malonyltransferase n=1 Tax=Aggregatilinea sp. TaxID=2806333 RepID=UPI002CE9F3AA|nr:ACP S-malonyltransferase [Aggregatilinea sp.]HML22200.1 ACP S-malonyltransferase [Aggregatilinea sp.]